MPTDICRNVDKHENGEPYTWTSTAEKPRCPECGARGEPLSGGGSSSRSESVTVDGVEVPGFLLEYDKIRNLLSDRIEDKLSGGEGQLTDRDIEQIDSQIRRHFENREDLTQSEAKKKEQEARAQIAQVVGDRIGKYGDSPPILKRVNDSLDDAGFYDNLGGKIKGGFNILLNKLTNPEKSLANVLADLDRDDRKEIMRDFLDVKSEASESVETEPPSKAVVSDFEASGSGEKEFTEEEVDAMAFVFSLGLGKILIGALERMNEEVGDGGSSEDIMRSLQELRSSGCPEIKKLGLLWDFSGRENELLSVCMDEDMGRFLRTFSRFVLRKMKDDSEYRNVVTSVIRNEVESVPDGKVRELWENREDILGVEI